jgi:hypothetical protein
MNVVNHPNRKKGSVLQRIKAIADTGRETRRTPGGWDIPHLRFAYYPTDGHWVLASLNRSGEVNPVIHANSRASMHRRFDELMDEIVRRVHPNMTR